jgi:hypothetical protein
VLLAAMGGGPAPALRLASGADATGLLDPHPTDLLRLHLGLGALATLAGFSGRAAAATRIEALAAAFATGDTITLTGGLPADPQRLDPITATAPRAAMAAAAAAVGAYIATTPLKALGGRSIQAIETWDDADEADVTAIRAALAAGQPIIGLGDDAQLLAGASSSAIDGLAAYDAITSALNAALDHSFATDPVWSLPPPDRMYLRTKPAP